MGGRTFQVTVTPTFPNVGRAVITITATDPELFKTSTSFVLDVIDATNTPPSFVVTGGGNGVTFVEHDVRQSSPAYAFKVTDVETAKSNLLVTAVSSNATLVANDSAHLTISTIASDGSATLTVTPTLPLPSPSPGVPQASTITLTVADQAYQRRMQFLYVAQRPDWAKLSFSRPTGVYHLDPKDTARQRPADNGFVTGEMHRISWRKIDNGGDPSTWDWSELDNAFMNRPANEDLSLNLIEEPCDIANSATYTYCDGSAPNGQYECTASLCTPTSVKRALPWDSYLRGRRLIFLQQLAHHVLPVTGNTVAAEPLIPIVNPNLPGGDTGIRELDMTTFNSTDFPGYSRTALLGAVQDELRTLLMNFPSKLIQIGFFTVEDNLNSNFMDESLWHWLYRQLTNEFNGTRRARVHFFQEDLAASRASAVADYIPYVFPVQKSAYSFFPNHCQLPSFAFNCGSDVMTQCDPAVPCTPTNSEYNNGITYQSNTPWSAPALDGDKVTKTLNSTPNDGLEGGFDSYLNEYLEVYLEDLDHAQAPTGIAPAWDAAKWKAGLQSWHDYFALLRTRAPAGPPAGLTVNRTSSTNNAVSWDGVYGASSYTLQRRSLSPLTDWTNVTGCDPLGTSCTDTTSTGSQYAYRVQASNATGTILSPWSQVAVFLSEGGYDGLVSGIAGVYVPLPNVIQPGIQAGQGAAVDLEGFLSFATSSLGSAATILDAKLRLKQFTSNDPFGTLGSCLVDIRKGDFNGSEALEALEALDFTTTATDLNVFQEGELIGVDPGNWVETYLDPAYISDVNNIDRTQFRIHFNHINGLNNTWVGWYSGESLGNEPQLLVRYSEG